MDYMILESASQHYAIPSRFIAEVVEPVTVSPLPFAPEYVEGLVRIAGKVMLQIGLAARLGQAQDPAETGVLVIVRDSRGHTHALRTERVLSNTAIDEAEINLCQSEPETPIEPHAETQLAARFISAEFQWNGHMVMALEADSLLPEELACRATETETASEIQTVAERSDDALACMVVESGNERYALHLDEVAEVAECGAPTTLPHAPPEVAGMALLRGEALLALSLNGLLGRDDAARHAALVVVVRDGIRLGLLVEKVLGIRHYPASAIHPVDKMGVALSAYAAEQNGRLTSVIDLHGLITTEAFESYRKFIAETAHETRAGETEDLTSVRMLGFSVGANHCALPLDWIERVEDAHDIADVLDGAEPVSGAALILGEVVPVVDLRREIGAARDTPGVWLVVRQDGAPWALAVDKVERVVEMLVKDIETVKHAASDYIGSVGRVGDRLISILTLEPLHHKTV